MKQVKINVILLIFVLSAILLLGCVKDSNALGTQDAKTIANECCAGVGIIRDNSQGSKGAPIIILEENHASRAGQIEQAITLVRLYERYGLKHIALEGYLKERPEIKTDWFISASKDLSPAAKARIVIGFLKEGEISCAEFMKLAYSDISLHPIETITEYNVSLDNEVETISYLYLLKIAYKSIQQEHIPKINQLADELKGIEKTGNKEKIEKKRKEMFDYILSIDPWVQSKVKILQDEESLKDMSSEQYLALLNEIISRSETSSIELEPKERDAMNRCLEFYRGRIAASNTMVLTAEEIADKQNVPIIAMIIGAWHTEGMCNILRGDDRSFAVVRHLSYGDEKGSLNRDMVERKYRRESIYSDGFMGTFLKAFPSLEQKKPEPVISEPWFQAKAELYTYIERLTRAILVPPKPPGGGKPPYDFPDDAFKGRWIYIDPNRVSITSDRKDSKSRAILFPITLNPDDPSRKTEMWIKTGLNNAMVPEQERESVESMLQKALEEVKKEEPRNKAEGTKGRVQITLNTIAGFAKTKQGAQNIILGSI